MRQKKSNKFAEFFADKGFYIILILCITAIGISGYVLFFSGSEGDTVEPPYLMDPSDFITDADPSETTLQTAIPDNAIRDTEFIMDPPSIPPDDPDAEEDLGEDPGPALPVVGTTDIPDPVVQPVIASFYVWPVNGEITDPFSVDELVFNATMDDWRVHTGIDIAGALGSEVACMGDGTVEDVYTDELYGVTVVINHNNGVRSVYRNLMEAVPVSIDDTVYAGDVIGGIGNTAGYELLSPSHLHLEVIKDGAQIDPCILLP